MEKHDEYDIRDFVVIKEVSLSPLYNGRGLGVLKGLRLMSDEE